MTRSPELSRSSPPKVGSQEPRVRSVPGTAVRSLAAPVLMICKTANHLGGTLEQMPWQESLLTDILSVRADGKWAGRDVAYLVARQNGKGGVLHALELAGLFLFPEVKEILHSAHEVKTAKKAFRELKAIIKDTPHLYARVERRGNRVVGFRHSNEDISITVVNPDETLSVVRFIARATNTGRGFSPQWLIIDEAQICTEEAREAIFYSTRAQANPLRVWCGTVPKANDPSEPFTTLRDRGRAGGDQYLTWNEWSVDPDIEPEKLRGDDDAVIQATPALGHLVDWETIESERAAAVSEAAWLGFCREALSWWAPDEDAAVWGVVSREAWTERATKETAEEAEALAAAGDPGWLRGAVALAVEMDQDHSYTSIAAAGDCREGRRGEVSIGVDIVARSEGSAWVVDHIVALTNDKAKPVSHVVIDPRSPAGSLIDDLRAAGVTVTECGAKELVQATSYLIDIVNEGGLVHRSSPELDRAVSVATTRRGSEGTVLIDRWGAVDASPFICVDLAVWGHRNVPEPEPETYAAVAFA